MQEFACEAFKQYVKNSAGSQMKEFIMNKVKSVILSLSALLLAQASFAAEGNTYSVGAEGFYDNYREPDATVNSHATYGSVTGEYKHDFDGSLGDSVFVGIDGRASYGKDHYSSIASGSGTGVVQLEFDGRVKTGIDYSNGISPYVGLGLRYYEDEGKNTVTTIDAAGYDRRITQLYLPVGASYTYTGYGLKIVPNIEYDQLLYGNVNSRLQYLGNSCYAINQLPCSNDNNRQMSGYGVRGDMMFSLEGSIWQFGPFVRYWNINQSEITNVGPNNVGFVEPENKRLQIGAALKATW